MTAISALHRELSQALTGTPLASSLTSFQEGEGVDYFRSDYGRYLTRLNRPPAIPPDIGWVSRIIDAISSCISSCVLDVGNDHSTGTAPIESLGYQVNHNGITCVGAFQQFEFQEGYAIEDGVRFYVRRQEANRYAFSLLTENGGEEEYLGEGPLRTTGEHPTFSRGQARLVELRAARSARVGPSSPVEESPHPLRTIQRALFVIGMISLIVAAITGVVYLNGGMSSSLYQTLIRAMLYSSAASFSTLVLFEAAIRIQRLVQSCSCY